VHGRPGDLDAAAGEDGVEGRVLGGMSESERPHVQARVRAAMDAQVVNEGRHQGGRAPYGYVIVDGGPHPNPRKAAEGFRAQALTGNCDVSAPSEPTARDGARPRSVNVRECEEADQDPVGVRRSGVVGPVGLAHGWLWRTSLEHGELVTQDEDLDFFGRVGSGAQDQPGQELGHPRPRSGSPTPSDLPAQQ
jgi:hypothetical protein